MTWNQLTMSIINQARLSLSSQRYLATATRCRDARDGFGSFNCINYESIHDQASKKGISNTKQAGDQPDNLYERSPRNIIAAATNHRNHHHQRICKLYHNTPIEGENPTRFRTSIREKPFDGLAKMASIKSAFDTDEYTPNLLKHVTTNNSLLTMSSCRRSIDRHSGSFTHQHIKHIYLLKGDWMSNTIDPISDKSQSDQGYRNNGRKDERSIMCALISLLGIMGLFMSKTASDIEEEQGKLTDEQKMKKMKPVDILIAKGVLAMCDQEYGKANELFHQALALTQDEKNEEQETQVLNLLASNSFESGDLESAEKLFIELIRRLVAKDVEPTDSAILELSLKLASIYGASRSTHEKAMKGFKFVITSLLGKLRDTLDDMGELLETIELSDDIRDELALLGWSYDWFAKHLLALNDYDGAADMLRRALQISSKVLGPLHDQTLILLNDIGTTLAMDNAPEKGKAFIMKAVEGAIESQSKELASFYVNLGLVNLKLRQLSEAKRYCEYSIELALKNREHQSSQNIVMLSKNCLSEVERLLNFEKQ